MKYGTVKFYSQDRRFGFVTPSIGGNKDIYFSAHAVDPADLSHLKSGVKVFYELETHIPTSRPAARTIKLAGVEI
jgi:cold shock CspA family protein